MTLETILVTGAAGFVGYAVRQMLERRGSKVVALDLVAETEPGVANLVCNLTDVHRLHALLKDSRIDGIIHCGGLSGPMLARDNPNALVQVNVVGTENLLEAARIHGISRFVYCSSAGAYGNTPPGPVREDVALCPTNVYGATKAAGEQLVSSYASQYGIDGVSLRLSWVYGPRRATDCVIRTMLVDALDGRPTRMPFGQGFYRQFVHIDDVARALVSALDRKGLPRRNYTVTGGSYVTLDQVATIVSRVLPDANIELALGPDPGDDLQQRFDISAAERDLDYLPAVSLEDGIHHYSGWLRSRREHG
jgi:nucleoside-diphosphate-sugar epimerase